MNRLAAIQERPSPPAGGASDPELIRMVEALARWDAETDYRRHATLGQDHRHDAE